MLACLLAPNKHSGLTHHPPDLREKAKQAGDFKRLRPSRLILPNLLQVPLNPVQNRASVPVALVRLSSH